MIDAPEKHCSRGFPGKWLLFLILIGLAVRLLIAWRFVGTNDVETWRGFGAAVERGGLAVAYQKEAYLNHPPIPTLWAWVCWMVHEKTNAHFAILIKLPAIIADAVSCVLLYAIGVREGDKRRGLLLAAIMTFCPIAILVSGYHGNTDNVYVMFVLAACLSLDRKRPLLAGLLLGAALNVKVIPVLLLPAIFLTQARWRDVGRLIAGLAIMSLPFLIALVNVGLVLIKKLFGYSSNEESWGVMMIMSILGLVTNHASEWDAFAKAYNHTSGRWIMLGLLLAAAIISRLRNHSATIASAFASCIFLITAPGFGVQYLVLPTLLLVATIPRFGFHIGWIAGLFVGFTYYQFANHAPRTTSLFYNLIQPPASLIGLTAWATLLLTAIVLIFSTETHGARRLEEAKGREEENI